MRVATVETKGSKKAANRKRKQEAAKGGSKSDDDDTTPSGVKVHAGKYTPHEYKKLKPFEKTEVKRLRSVEAAARKVSMVVAGPEVPSEADHKPSPSEDAQESSVRARRLCGSIPSRDEASSCQPSPRRTSR